LSAQPYRHATAVLARRYTAIARHHDVDVMAETRQSHRQCTYHIGETSRLGKRHRLGGDRQDAHGDIMSAPKSPGLYLAVQHGYDSLRGRSRTSDSSGALRDAGSSRTAIHPRVTSGAGRCGGYAYRTARAPSSSAGARALAVVRTERSDHP